MSIGEVPYITHLSTPGGRPAVAQLVIHQGGYKIFKSYNSIVAIKAYGTKSEGYREKVYLVNPYWDNYSATTNRYLLQFLDEHSIKDVRASIANNRTGGRYRIIDSIKEIGGHWNANA